MKILHGTWRGCRVALAVEGRTLTDTYIERGDCPNLVGGIARVQLDRVLKGGGQAFATLPNGSTGFLHGKALQPGQQKLVQVSAYPEGAKAWLLSAELKLSSAALIHLPHGGGVHASKRLQPDQAAALTPLLTDLPGGWIVRRQAGALTPANLQANAAQLRDRATALENTGPGWLVTPPAVLDRAMQEVPGCAAQPASEDELDNYLAPLLTRKIMLSIGGSITLSPTPALLAVDIDAGEAVNAGAVNLAAIEASASALRSCSLGGQIIIDPLRANGRAALLKKLASLLENDPLATTLYGATKLGLIELTRPRVAPSLFEVIHDN